MSLVGCLYKSLQNIFFSLAYDAIANDQIQRSKRRYRCCFRSAAMSYLDQRFDNLCLKA